MRKSRITIPEGLDYYAVNDLINRWVFNETYRAILKRKLLDGKTYEVVAEEFNLSVNTVKDIVYKGRDKIFKHYK